MRIVFSAVAFIFLLFLSGQRNSIGQVYLVEVDSTELKRQTVPQCNGYFCTPKIVEKKVREKSTGSCVAIHKLEDHKYICACAAHQVRGVIHSITVAGLPSKVLETSDNQRDDAALIEVDCGDKRLSIWELGDDLDRDEYLYIYGFCDSLQKATVYEGWSTSVNTCAVRCREGQSGGPVLCRSRRHVRGIISGYDRFGNTFFTPASRVRILLKENLRKRQSAIPIIVPIDERKTQSQQPQQQQQTSPSDISRIWNSINSIENRLSKTPLTGPQGPPGPPGPQGIPGVDYRHRIEAIELSIASINKTLESSTAVSPPPSAQPGAGLTPGTTSNGGGDISVDRFVIVVSSIDYKMREAIDKARGKWQSIVEVSKSEIPKHVVIRSVPTLIAFSSDHNIAGMWDGEYAVRNQLYLIAQGKYP